MAVLFDTDAFLAYLRDSNAIGAAARTVIEKAGNELATSAATVLALKKRLTASEYKRVLIKLASTNPGVRVIPIDLDTVAASETFEGSDEERVIAATASKHHMTLIASKASYMQPGLTVVLARQLRVRR